MTMAIGFKCPDGIVLCTDSKESDGVTVRNVDKTAALFYMIPHNWGVALVGAGAILDKVFDAVVKELQQKTDGHYDKEQIEEIVERILAKYRKKYRANRFRILMGLFYQNRLESFLYRSDDSALVPIHDHAQVGYGGSLWSFLVETFYDEDMTCEECAALGARIASEHVDSVGGPTRIIMYKKGHGMWRHPKRAEIAEMQNKVPISELEELLRRYWRTRQKFKRVGER